MPEDSVAIRNRSWPRWRWGVTGLSALGLTLSSVLSWHSLAGGALMMGCGGGGPCDVVLSSRWSTIAGVLPVSGVAASAYLAMLVSSFAIGPANPAPVRRLAWNVLLVLAGAAAGSALWFTAVQKWVLGAFCPFCMTAHLTGLVLTALMIRCAPRDFAFADVREESTPLGPRESRLRRVLGRVLGGVALATLLVAAQVGLPSRENARGGQAPDARPAIDARAVPLIGSPNARTVVTLLFDYKCPHCQQLHLMLGEAVRRYHGQLAFALGPAPLNRACNPYVPRDVDEFKDSCELAQVGLAVWLVDREAFRAFDDWMYAFESGDRWRPRTLAAATAKAIELVGSAKFESARTDPWIARYLQTSVRLYGETMQNGAGGVPKMIFGSRWIVPQPGSAAELISLLQNRLGVPAP